MFGQHAALIHAIALASIKASPGDTPDETIDGFPEYAFTANTLDPSVAARLRKLARRIASSHATRTDIIIGFEVHGHSDNAMRVSAGAEREQTELEVSRDRAENARELLLKLIEEEGGKPFMGGIRANATAQWFGSRHTKFSPARTEAERRQNRRVEFFLKRFRPPPPRPTPPPGPTPPQPRETGTNWRVRIRFGNITSVTIPEIDIVPANFFFMLEITDLDRKQKATFNVHARGMVLPGAALGPPVPFQTITVSMGPPRDFTTTRGVLLSSFEGTVSVGQNPSAGGLFMSRGGSFVFDFAALPALTRPRMVDVAGANSFTVIPEISGGIAPGPDGGSMTMKGAPVPVP